MIAHYTKRGLLSLLAGMICWNLHAQLEREQVQVLMDRLELLEVKTGDMDGDGDEDVVAACNAWDGHIAIFENLDGEGGLAWPRLYGDSLWAGHRNILREFELIDMDQDGDLDVVDAYRALEAVPYWVNDGQGHLQPGSDEPLVYTPIVLDERFKVGDVNGDGWLDVVIGLDANYILVNLNPGNGGAFQHELAYHSTGLDVKLVDLELGDVDQDGDLDIFVLENYHTDQSTQLTLHILEYTALGYSSLWRSFLEFEPDKLAWFDCDLSTVDVTGNGFPDAVYSHSGYGAYSRAYTVYLQVAPSGQSEVFWQSGDTSGLIAHTVVDIDQDTDMDLLAFQEGSGYVWMERMPSGQLDTANNLIDDLPTGSQLSVGDLNGDGVPDLLTHGPDNALADGREQLVSRLGPLHAGNPTPPVPLTRATGYIRDLQPWDWDADGAMDVLFCDESGIAWLRNEGAPSYSPPIPIWEPPFSMKGFEFAQLDNDSLPDGLGVLGASPVGQVPVIWFSSTGDTLSFPQFELRHGYPYDVADVDGDGDQDIVLLTRTGEVVLLWNTSGSFAAQIVIPDLPGLPDYTSQVLADDFDSDGDADLVLGGLGGKVYFARHLDGEGQFASLQEVEGMEGVRALFSGDYDLDGRKDLRGRYIEDLQGELVVASYDTAQQAWAPAVERGRVGNGAPISEALLNGDSIPDLVNSSGFVFSVGTTGFVSTPYVPDPFNSVLPSALTDNASRTDLDGDGTAELVTGNQEVIAYPPNFSGQQLVHGQMVWDTTFSCTFNSELPGLPDGQLLLEGQTGHQQILSATSTGYYAGYLPDTASYTLGPVLPNDYWQACPPDTILQGPGPHQAHFAVSPTVECPLMELGMALGAIRQCFNSSVVLHYNNAGTVAADSVAIQLYFDSRMAPVSASVPWSMQTDTSLTFELGTVAVEAGGDIVVRMEPDCEQLLLGEILCYQAHITPDTLCAPGLTGWEGGSLRASYQCAQDSLKWEIENTGFGPVSIPVPYELNIVNDDIVLLQSGSLEVLPGASVLLAAPADSTAYLLEAAQPEGHPAPEPIRLLAEGCLMPLDTGLVTAFPNHNGSPFEVEQCRPVIGAYDPNIKVAYPQGFGPGQLIPAEEALQYTIHFQNVGTDMARNVTIRDTLSPELDLATFRAEGGSHAHDWHLLPGRVLVVEYPEILLPDSTTNEPESHGFFAFSIQPRTGILPATLLENRAGIYFDFNPPVITNTVAHQIEKPVVASTVYASLCPGDVYLGQELHADTILEERFVAPLRDSVVWHHINIVAPDDTTVVQIDLEQPGWWQGALITADTMVTAVYQSVAGCDSLVRYEVGVLVSAKTGRRSTQWVLAPNPAVGQSVLSWPAGQPGPQAVYLYSALGQRLEELPLLATGRQLLVPLHNRPPGLYWLEVWRQGQFARLPLVVAQ